MRKRLIDVEPEYMTQGIFAKLALMPATPWTTPASTLNMVYYMNHSGQKSASPMVRTLASVHDDGLLSSDDEATLAGIALGMFGENWTREFATLSAQYEPLENYNMTEEETPHEMTTTRTPSEYTDTETPPETTRTITPPETTETETPPETTVTDTPPETTASGSNDSGIYGVNSTDSVGSDTLSAETSYTTDTAGTTKTETDTAGTKKTQTDSAGTDKVETDTAGTIVRTVQSAETISNVVDNPRILTRSGNIGVTTSQQMLQSEREVWTWNFFYDIVFKNLDSLLTLQTY